MSGNAELQPVYAVTLSSGKKVILREMQIKYQELAAKAVGSKAGEDNKILAGSLLQKELLKILIVEIDGKKPAAADLEKLDKLFTYKDYLQLTKVLDKITGGDDLGEFQMEIVTSGAGSPGSAVTQA